MNFNMNNWLNRTENLIGESALNHLIHSTIAIVGIGGAGIFGYTALNKKKQEKVAARPDPDADYEDEDDEEYIIPDDDASDEEEMSEEFEDDEN